MDKRPTADKPVIPKGTTFVPELNMMEVNDDVVEHMHQQTERIMYLEGHLKEIEHLYVKENLKVATDPKQPAKKCPSRLWYVTAFIWGFIIGILLPW